MTEQTPLLYVALYILAVASTGAAIGWCACIYTVCSKLEREIERMGRAYFRDNSLRDDWR